MRLSNGIGVREIRADRSSSDRSATIIAIVVSLRDGRPEAEVVKRLLVRALTDNNVDVGDGSFAEKLRALADECDAAVAREQLKQKEQPAPQSSPAFQRAIERLTHMPLIESPGLQDAVRYDDDPRDED